MEREGFQPATRSRTTRRALTGVAAGAVLALGAVVGSLLINHGTQNTAGDTLASGSPSGGDIVLAQSSAPSAPSVQNNQVSQNSVPAAPPTSSAPANTANAGQLVQHRSTGGVTSGAVTNHATGTQGATSKATPTAPTTAPAAASTTPTAPATGTSTPSPQSTPAPSTSTGNATTSNTAATTSTSSSPGLIGTVSGTLSSVTSPLFNWFGN